MMNATTPTTATTIIERLYRPNVTNIIWDVTYDASSFANVSVDVETDQGTCEYYRMRLEATEMKRFEDAAFALEQQQQQQQQHIALLSARQVKDSMLIHKNKQKNI